MNVEMQLLGYIAGERYTCTVTCTCVGCISCVRWLCLGELLPGDRRVCGEIQLLAKVHYGSGKISNGNISGTLQRRGACEY